MRSGVSKGHEHFLRIVSAIVFLFFFGASLSFAEPVSPADLEKEVTGHRLDIPEFKAIAEEAKARGLRVYLLGGSAASLADHGKARVLSSQGKLSSAPARLAWELNNLLFPEQDVDLVITKANGNPESVAEINDFREWVRREFPYQVDGRSRWDVLGLQTEDTVGGKMALKGNPDFLHQNNDSLSLGMIELTKPPRGESVFSDLGTPGVFLEDSAGDELHFYRDSRHGQTKYFQAGRNPEILSVVRTLEKATRYEKQVDAQGVKAIRKIINEWDPSSISPGSYVDNYLNGRGKRIVTHAKNLHQAFELLELTGLKDKLQNTPYADASAAETLAWWVNKKPLPLDSADAAAAGLYPTGRTAADLGITKVTHWTSYPGHRLLSWNYDGKPRLFESRQGVAGERAVLGSGFYTYKNFETNSTYSAANQEARVTFGVNPQAREGLDFVLEAGNVVIWKNSSALRVEHEPTHYPNSYTCSNSFLRLGGTAGLHHAGASATPAWPGPSGQLHNSVLASQPAPSAQRGQNLSAPINSPPHARAPAGFANSFKFASTPDQAVIQILNNPAAHKNIQLEFGAIALRAQLKNKPLELSELCEVASRHHGMLDYQTIKLISDLVKADPLSMTMVKASAQVLRKIGYDVSARQMESYPYLLYDPAHVKLLQATAAKQARITNKISVAAQQFWKEHPGWSITGATLGGLVLFDQYDRWAVEQRKKLQEQERLRGLPAPPVKQP